MDNKEIGMDRIELTARNAEEELGIVKDLFLAKLHDYGVDDLKEPEQIIQRMEEKMGRVKRLRSQGLPEAVTNEKIADTAQDLIGYSLILTLMLQGKWGNNKNKSEYKAGDVVEVVKRLYGHQFEIGESLKILVINPDFSFDCIGKSDKIWCLTREEVIPYKRKTELEKQLIGASIQIVRNCNAKEFDIPRPKKDGDVGYDLYTIEETIIPHNTQFPVDVPTGCKVKLPKGTWGMIINRSSTPRKLGLEVVPGVIDNGYTGELFACVWNRTGEEVVVPRGCRLAQMVLFNSLTPQIVEVNQLPDTERGDAGFGSTNDESQKDN